MSTWTLHLVGQNNEANLQELVTGFVASVESAGYVLQSATLGTDGATTSLAVTGDPEDGPGEPVGAGEHVVTDDPDNPVESMPEPAIPTDTAPSL